MRLMLAAALLSLTLSGLAGPARAASEEEVYDRIEAVLGDAQGLAEPMLTMRDAVASGRPADMLEVVEFPLRVTTEGSTTEIAGAEDFIEAFPTLFPTETAAAIAAMAYGDLIVTSDGVGIADGAVWMSPVCEDDACTASHWAVTAINF